MSNAPERSEREGVARPLCGASARRLRRRKVASRASRPALAGACLRLECGCAYAPKGAQDSCGLRQAGAAGGAGQRGAGLPSGRSGRTRRPWYKSGDGRGCSRRGRRRLHGRVLSNAGIVLRPFGAKSRVVNRPACMNRAQERNSLHPRQSGNFVEWFQRWHSSHTGEDVRMRDWRWSDVSHGDPFGTSWLRFAARRSARRASFRSCLASLASRRAS
jgi:hypothetical protein